MLNREQRKEELVDIMLEQAVFGINEITGEVMSCYTATMARHPNICEKCIFHTEYPKESCRDSRKRWLNQEYIKLPTDWSEIAIDTPVLVRNDIDEKWHKKHFAEYKNGMVYTWDQGIGALDDGSTSWSSQGGKVPWKLAKLGRR